MNLKNNPQKKDGKICVSIAASTVTEALKIARTVTTDVLEIRLDSLVKAAIRPFFDTLKTPLLFTNRPVWEGGNFKGEESARLTLLEEAVQAGAAYVDIELRTLPSRREQIINSAKEKTKTIVSWHDFDTTPENPELSAIVQEMEASGATIGKLVTTAHNFQDVLRVLYLQIEAAKINFPLIAFCMGKPGMISRIATLKLGGYMTYAAPEAGQGTAPGQLPAEKLRRILKELHHAD